MASNKTVSSRSDTLSSATDVAPTVASLRRPLSSIPNHRPRAGTSQSISISSVRFISGTQTSDGVATQNKTFALIDLRVCRQGSRKRDWACYSSEEEDSDSSGSESSPSKKIRASASGLVDYALLSTDRMTLVCSMNYSIPNLSSRSFQEDYPPSSSEETSSDSDYDSAYDVSSYSHDASMFHPLTLLPSV